MTYSLPLHHHLHHHHLSLVATATTSTFSITHNCNNCSRYSRPSLGNFQPVPCHLHFHLPQRRHCCEFTNCTSNSNNTSNNLRHCTLQERVRQGTFYFAVSRTWNLARRVTMSLSTTTTSTTTVWRKHHPTKHHYTMVINHISISTNTNTMK